MHRPDGFRPGARGDRQPVDRAERRGQKAADNASRDHPISDICHLGISPDQIDRVKNDCGRQQSQRKHDHYGVDGVSEYPRLALHLNVTSCAETRNTVLIWNTLYSCELASKRYAEQVENESVISV